MRELRLQVLGAEAAPGGLTPLLQFKLRIEAVPPAEPVKALLLNAQLQLECPQRAYTPAEQEKLVELFGTPERWGQTLRNRLWTHVQATVGPFEGSTEVLLPVQCTYDLNVATAKYFYALEGGEVSVLFLFSGSVFYLSVDGRLQFQPICWNTECTYRLAVQAWRDLMERAYPNYGWLRLERDALERLYAYKRRQGLATWEQTIARLLERQAAPQTLPGQLPEEVVI